MVKIKNIGKGKKIIFSLLLLFVIVGILFLYFGLKETKELKEEYYEIWINNEGNVEAIIYFKEEYEICKNFFKSDICSDKEITITKIEEINENLEKVNIEDLKLEETINLLLKNIEEELNIDKITLISNYQFSDNFKNKIKENNIDVEFLYGNLSYTAEHKETKYYTVNFDTDKASNIDSVVVKEGDLLDEPNEPVKEGYTFINWTLEGKEYDFNTPITEGITLKANWKKNKTTSHKNNDSSSNNNKNDSSPSTKINLNDHIMITEYHVSSGTLNCFYYMFVANLQSVFPTAQITKRNGGGSEVDFWHTKSERQEDEISTEEINEYLSNGTLKINTAKETSFKNTLDKYKNKKYIGIANISYQEENHRFSFTYDYIDFNGLKIANDGDTANKEIQNILVSATKFNGPCGGFDDQQNKELDEELCDKYNLDCGRW